MNFHTFEHESLRERLIASAGAFATATGSAMNITEFIPILLLLLLLLLVYYSDDKRYCFNYSCDWLWPREFQECVVSFPIGTVLRVKHAKLA